MYRTRQQEAFSWGWFWFGVGVYCLAYFAILYTVIYVVWHFVEKYW
jgi:hypothetical protein